jgi:HAD superfamily hydrolase (TIGR01509 family)
MKWLSSYDLILLDLDGLLVDTERIHCEAYRELARRYGYVLDWSLFEFLGIAHRGSDELVKAFYPHLSHSGKDWQTLYEEKKEIYLERLAGETIGLMPGVGPFLEALFASGKKSCVVTNSPKEQVDAIRKNLPVLEGIGNWITREDYGLAKPAPDGYLKAVELHGEEGDRKIGFEDSLKGLRALEAAKVPAVLVCDPQHPQMKDKGDRIWFPSFLDVRI